MLPQVRTGPFARPAPRPFPPARGALAERERALLPDVTGAPPRAFVVVDDYELVATSQDNPLDPLVPLLAQAADIGLHVIVARRSGGAGRMYDNLVTGLRDLAQPGLLLSGDPAEGPLVGQLRAVPAVPGRARMLTRDGFNLVQVGWTASAHDA